MGGSDKFLLLDPKNLLPSQFIPTLLGRVCDNPNQPWANYFPEDPTSFYSSTAAPFHIKARSTSVLLGRNTTGIARFLIEDLLSIEREKAKKPTANWFGELSRVFNLPQEREVLSNMLHNPQLKEKAEQWLDDDRHLYMITGFVTVVNASCQVANSESSSVGFDISITKALEAAILGVGGVPVELPSISAEWRNQSDKSVEWSATYAGESIIAIRYRQLQRKGLILSRLLSGEIVMRKNLDIRGSEDMMFGPEHKRDTQEVKEWELCMSEGLDEDEEGDVVLSPSYEVELQTRDERLRMDHTLFIAIEEVAPVSGAGGGRVKVMLSFHHPEGYQDNNTAVQAPLTRIVTVPQAEKEIEWYFERYPRDPFLTVRANNARNLINGQTSLLLEELEIDYTLICQLGFVRIVFEILQGTELSKIHWEALESPEIWKKDTQVTVCRIALGEQARLQRAPTHIDIQKCINVLLVVARGKNDAIDPRLTSRPLLQKLGQDSSGSVSVDIARPGTREEFLSRLCEKDYDIVHLDVHGKVRGDRAFLLFQDPDDDYTVEVSADDIGKALFVNRVKLVIMNACQSASTTGSSTANFAHQLASHGVPYVLGMAFKITHTAVEIFTSALHDCLLWSTRNILLAVHEARAKLRVNKERTSDLFGLTFSLQDDILPVLEWLHESCLVKHVFHVDCSSGISSLDSVLANIRQQVDSVTDTERREKPETEDLVLETLFSQATLLVFQNIEEGANWLAELSLKLAVLERSKDAVPLFILISSRTSLLSVRRKLSRMKPGRHFAYELKSLNSVSATKLADNLLKDKQHKEESYSALWYRQSIFMLLQHNPLAIEVVIPVIASHESHEVYWHLKTGNLDLDWEASRLKQLFLQWKHLIDDHSGLLQALIPFTTSVPEDYLAKVFAIYRVDPSARKALVEAGCTNTQGVIASIGPLRLHPLFSQFTRSQPSSEEDITSSWRRAAAYYHDRSIDWIKTGLYSPTTQKSKPKDEWENLTAVLSHIIPELENDTEESALFDLSWVVGSFHVFHKDIPKHAVDMFADLTLKALNAMVPEFVPTSNEGLRFVVNQGLYARARKLSDFQILRITLLVQFLVHYYYDISLKTASIYQDALMILQDAVPTSLDDQEFQRLFSMATSISFLTDCELSCEEGRMPKTMDLWTDVSSDLGLPSTFRPFADVWGKTHAYRRMGFVLDLTETWRNHQNRARYSVDSSEDFSLLKSLDTLVDAFDALNTASSNQGQDPPPLDQSLRDAIQRYDTRSQLDIYGKLVEVYFNSGDWETVLFVLDKIDQCSDDICRFRGTNIDDVSTLEQKRWMTTRRVQCLRHLGRISESKERIEELKNIVSRREDLWTSQDRRNEQYQNLTAVMERQMGRLSPSTRVNAGDYVFRPRTFHEAEVSQMQDSKVSLELGTNLKAEKAGGVAQETGDVHARFANTTTMGASNRNLSCYEAGEDGSDNLYLINKPWMKEIMGLINSFGTPVEEHCDFQTPPGRIGGLFLYQSRALMVDAFLKALGVLQPELTGGV
ncbi:hypothetical protein FANTH_9583 [Fusarium anthophilum]|uniref:CHAT domain-containing protein n=1 Tax=Fusarium anthophilum TaxID=48485 RepID=A0A8H4Z5S1_9HYPO|nr:hypothetical protein FANTH_9583 [Fusarium anthophilum]